MKQKKGMVIAVAIVCTISVAAFFIVPYLVDAHRNKMIEQYTQNNIELYSELNVISDCATIDDNLHSLAGIKEAFRLGADTVTVDLCFCVDGTPVVIDDYSDINDNTLRAEKIFELLNTDGYKHAKLNFRLRQLSSLSEFNRLVNEYDLSKRIMISGIDADRYSLISGTDTPAKVYFDFEPSDDIEESVNAATALVSEHNLSGIIINFDEASSELIDTLSQKGISYIVRSVDKESDMYLMMSYGVYAIETNHPDMLKDAYTGWQEITLKRLNATVMDELNK